METLLTQDFDTAQRSGIDGLIESLSRWRGGNLSIEPHDFSGATMGSRFYPLLYLLTRARGARDLCSGLELRASLLGHLSSLQVHHIFPKALLYKAGYERGDVNAVANFCLLTQKCNLEIGRQHPSEYLPKYEAMYPGVLASQWIPTDPDLWRVDRYRDFLDARREMLAAAANEFLGVLRSGTSTPAPPLPRAIVVVADEEPDARDEEVSRLVEALVAAGYAAPLRDAEISDPETGAVLAIAEAFWPEGLQPGQGPPIILELDPQQADRARLEELGYEIFTSVGALERHAARRSEIAAGLRTEE